MNIKYTDVALAICDKCNEEHKYSQKIFDELQTLFPHLDSMKGIPANHPYWAKHKELYNSYLTKCFTMQYDDFYLAICIKHLEEILNRMKNEL